jgi:hypothetical protein
VRASGGNFKGIKGMLSMVTKLFLEVSQLLRQGAQCHIQIIFIHWLLLLLLLRRLQLLRPLGLLWLQWHPRHFTMLHCGQWVISIAIIATSYSSRKGVIAGSLDYFAPFLFMSLVGL